MKIFERVFLARLLVALLIVVPPTYLYQKSVTNEATNHTLKKNQAAIAAEQVNRTLDGCRAFNEQRAADIARSEALIRVAAQSPPSMFSDRDRLLLAAFVVRANRALETVGPPKTCTVQSLHLQDLTVVANGDG